VDRILFANEHLAAADRPTYLEIGVQYGTAFRRISAATKIGVDPAFASRELRLKARLSLLKTASGRRRGDFLFCMPSDQFFASQRRLLAHNRLALALVDGLHTADQAFRDVIHCVEWLGSGGIVVMHDCNPQTRSASAPTREEAEDFAGFDGKWNGDVWKAVVRLRATRHDLDVCVLDCDEGLGLVTRRPVEQVLDLSPADLEHLDYDALEANRLDLLDLKPPGFAGEFMARARYRAAQQSD